MGDAKPSHHLTRLQSLAGNTTADSKIVKELWLESLPASIQPTITALLEDTPLNKVALIADKILARTSNRDNYIGAF